MPFRFRSVLQSCCILFCYTTLYSFVFHEIWYICMKVDYMKLCSWLNYDVVVVAAAADADADDRWALTWIGNTRTLLWSGSVSPALFFSRPFSLSLSLPFHSFACHYCEVADDAPGHIYSLRLIRLRAWLIRRDSCEFVDLPSRPCSPFCLCIWTVRLLSFSFAVPLMETWFVECRTFPLSEQFPAPPRTFPGSSLYSWP